MVQYNKEFYTEFNDLLYDVTREKREQKKISSSWLFAIGNVAGVFVLANIIHVLQIPLGGTRQTVGFFTRLVGMSEMSSITGIARLAGIAGIAGIASLTLPVAAFAIVAAILMRKLSEKSSESDRSKEIEQLTKAKIIFQDLQILRKSDPQAAKKEVDNLFKNLVEGERIFL